MKKPFTILLLPALLIACGVINAQEEKPQKSDEAADSNMQTQIEITKTILMGMFGRANLDKEQTAKIEKVLETHTKDLLITEKKYNQFLSKDEKRRYNKAKKLARAAKLSSEEVDSYALRKLKLGEERLAEYKMLRTKVTEMTDARNKALAAVLTKEQLAKVPMIFKGTKIGRDSKATTEAAKKAIEAEKKGSADKAGSQEKKGSEKKPEGSGKK